MRADAAGVPSAVRRNRDWRAVVDVLDRYRTDDRWWTAAPIARCYFELLLEDGRVVTVFRDEITDSWWGQRYG